MKEENKIVKGLKFTAAGLLFGTLLVREGISASLTKGDEGELKRVGRKIIINKGKILMKTIIGLSTTKLAQDTDVLEKKYYELSKK